MDIVELSKYNNTIIYRKFSQIYVISIKILINQNKLDIMIDKKKYKKK